MRCPTCPDSVLVMSERVGVEIDYCPTCRGVWLDRGELDKILEKASAELVAASAPAPAPQPAPQPVYQQAPPAYQPQPGYQQPYPQPGYGQRDPYYGKKKRKSFLDELFD